MEVSDRADQSSGKVRRLFWTFVTVLVWLVLIIGIGDLLIGVIGGSIAYVVWGLLFAAAAGWALLRGR